jgi:NAD(P)H-hydrate epimerase
LIPVLSREQMRAFDEHAIAKGVPSLVLMENAGRGAAEAIRGDRVVVLCGAGNNGGDGFVVARHLLRRGAAVEAWLCGDAKKMTPGCKANHDAFKGVGGTVHALGKAFDALVRSVAHADTIVDGLFGIGLDRPIAGPLAEVISIIAEGRAAGAEVVALDVPSGLDTDTGVPLGPCVKADRTVTFAHLKLGHATGSGAAQSGVVHVVDIGVPSTLREEPAASLIEAADVRAVLKPRGVDTHKYRAGHVALLAGSPGKTGAALLAAQGALRGGAGAATVVSSAHAVLEARIPEVMVVPLANLEKTLAKKAACLVGPGFGTDAAAKKSAQHVLTSFDGPVVADADAFTLFAGTPRAFRRKGIPAILTPHSGELGRLLGRDDVDADRFGAARDAAKATGAVVLLKGAYTVIASPDGRVVVTGSGSPALATAGSGDVLAGLVTALACTLPPFEAAYAGAFLHGVAGSAWSKEKGDRGLLAGEIAGELPGVIAALLA